MVGQKANAARNISNRLHRMIDRIFKRPFLWPGAISQDRERCQFPFVLDEKPTVVPVGSAGERSGGARKVLCGLRGRSASSAAIITSSVLSSPSSTYSCPVSLRRIIVSLYHFQRCNSSEARLDRPVTA